MDMPIIIIAIAGLLGFLFGWAVGLCIAYRRQIADLEVRHQYETPSATTLCTDGGKTVRFGRKRIVIRDSDDALGDEAAYMPDFFKAGLTE